MNLLQIPKLSDGRTLNNAKIIKGDTLIIKFRVSGDLSAATVKFGAIVQSDPLRTPVISKVSTSDDQILIEPINGGLLSECTLHIPSSDTGVFESGTVMEYEIELTSSFSYGGSTGDDITVSNAKTTISQGTFKIVPQVII